MGFLYYKQPKLNISFRSDYRKAVFGLFHVAFLDNNDHFILPIEDKEAISIALEFYQKRILKREMYPVYDGSSFFLRQSHDKEVLRQVLGLPDEVFDELDTNEDILSQLKFQSHLSNLKKECYVLLTQRYSGKWFRDDFKLYCLRKGFFFLYDETKPFIEREQVQLPVFIDETRLDEKYLRLYKEAISTRLAIDFLGRKDENQFNIEMAKLDAYSFDRRLSYFVNNDPDEEISQLNLDLSFKRKYAFLLREYLASLINVLYDDYSFDVLKKVAGKLSFLTVSKIHTNKDIYSLSSYHADMYSFDGKKFFFANLDKEKITHLFQDIIEEKPAASMLTIYASSGLPYEGFKYVQDVKEVNVDDILSKLPFGDVSTSEIYLSCKRYDLFYAYLSGEKEHRYTFTIRLLLDCNIQYLCDKPLLNNDHENKITIYCDKGKKSRELKTLFEKKKGSFIEEIFPAFLIDQKRFEDVELENALRLLDVKSHFEALPFFYHSFHNKSIANVLDLMLLSFDLQNLSKTILYPFFEFASLYPLQIAEQEYRIDAIERGDSLSLMVLDGLPNQTETYEPNMPYPYVCYGKLVYSFRETYFSKAYLCSCQREAIVSKYEYLSRFYDRYHEKKEDWERNKFILFHLGLPGNIVHQINLEKDLLPQLPFKDNLCHLCQHSAPSCHQSIDENEEDSHNVYLTYIRANAARNGLYFSDAISIEQDIPSFFESLSKKEFHTLLSFDRSRLDPILLPYINVSKGMIVSLLSCFFPNEMAYGNFYSEVLAFLSLDEVLISKIMFDCEEQDYPEIYAHMMIFTRLVYIYKMVEISYALYVSRDITPSNENEFTLNIDYNPSLPHPYVLLGNNFNAYADNLMDDKYYFCECDRITMKKFAKHYSNYYDSREMDQTIKVPIILGMLGLPYLVVLKYANAVLEDNDIEKLIDQMPFRHHICRRDLQIPHASYDEPFRLAYPFKENLQAEYNFAANQMMKDGFVVVSDYSLMDIRFRKNYLYDLDAHIDNNLPYFIYYSEAIPEDLFTFFVMSKDTLQNYLSSFSQLNEDKIETNAYASGVILDSFFKNNNVFLQFVFNDEDMTLRELVIRLFPEIERVREAYYDAVIQQILGFMSYLFENLFAKYATRESYIGR